jgi:hypothetical protein
MTKGKKAKFLFRCDRVHGGWVRDDCCCSMCGHEENGSVHLMCACAKLESEQKELWGKVQVVLGDEWSTFSSLSEESKVVQVLSGKGLCEEKRNRLDGVLQECLCKVYDKVREALCPFSGTAARRGANGRETMVESNA